MKNKSSIGIVIDSTTTLDPQLIKEYDIEVVSLNIHTQAFNKREIDTLDEEIIPLLDDVKISPPLRHLQMTLPKLIIVCSKKVINTLSAFLSQKKYLPPINQR